MLDVRSCLRRAATFHRDRTAVIADGRSLTFGQAWQRGLRPANALLDAGLLPGDRVGVLEDNSIEAADFYLGSAAANLVRVPLYRRNSATSHQDMIVGTPVQGDRPLAGVRRRAHRCGCRDAGPDGDRVAFRTESLPRSPVGEIQRKKLREPY
jgi:AMP-binding enzyme